MLQLLNLVTVSAIFLKDPPNSLDWRSLGVVPPVHNQGAMGDPAAFAVSDSLYAFENITEGKQISPSIDEITSCCGSRFTSNYFDCIAKIGGICSVNEWTSGDCGINNCTVNIVLSSSVSVLKGDEASLVKAILEVPVVVYINVNMAMEVYVGGVFDDPSCTPDGLNHAMLLVGYAPEYWILKNSWGESWGENGYVRLARGKNMCGVAEFAIYPSLPQYK